jgi:hypothetical protein
MKKRRRARSSELGRKGFVKGLAAFAAVNAFIQK